MIRIGGPGFPRHDKPRDEDQPPRPPSNKPDKPRKKPRSDPGPGWGGHLDIDA